MGAEKDPGNTLSKSPVTGGRVKTEGSYPGLVPFLLSHKAKRAQQQQKRTQTPSDLYFIAHSTSKQKNLVFQLTKSLNVLQILLHVFVKILILNHQKPTRSSESILP